jgi:hypothetical protein
MKATLILALEGSRIPTSLVNNSRILVVARHTISYRQALFICNRATSYKYAKSLEAMTYTAANTK